MTTVAQRGKEGYWERSVEAPPSDLDLLSDDELLDHIVDIINDNFVREVESSHARIR